MTVVHTYEASSPRSVWQLNCLQVDLHESRFIVSWFVQLLAEVTIISEFGLVKLCFLNIIIYT